MRKLLSILPLFLALSAFSAAERITLTLTVTNVPVTSNSLVINASTRYWTNAASATTFATNLAGINESATNLFDAISTYPYSGPLVMQWVETNSISLTAPLGVALAASSTGSWASLVLSTQSGPSTFTALWPIESMVGATNRTNQASSLVYGLGTYSTNAFATNSTAVTNLLVKGAVPAQTVSGSVTFGGLSGTGVLLTNGYWTNLVLQHPYTTNAWLEGGTLTNGTIVGASRLTTTGTGANNSLGMTSTGTAAQASAYIDFNRENGITTPPDAGDYLGSMFFNGYGDTINRQGAKVAAIAMETFSDTTAGTDLLFGTTPSGSASAVFRVAITDVGDVVLSNRLVVAGSTTNLTFRGTNVLNGRLDLTAASNASLADGNNAGVVLGTNTYLRLSGGSTIATIAGFAAEQNGSYHIVQISGAVTNIIANDSGVDPTAGNRIYTGTGGDITLTNNPAFINVIYDSAASRWRLINWTR